MPSLKVVRKRIVSVKSTQKITRAMKMVAGAKLNRAQQRILAMRPYAVKTGEILESVASSMTTASADSEASSEGLHALLARREQKKILFVLLSGDRGLCGGFNTNISKATEREWRTKQKVGVEVEFLTLGKKGREYIARRGGKIAHDFPKVYDGLDLAKARLIAHWIVSRFEKGEYDAIYLAYNEFKSAITQKVVFEPLLPLKETETKPQGDGTSPSEFLYEPNQSAILEQLMPMYIEISIYRALLESQASFFGAQMTAMDAATRNAKDMIGRLTLVYNRARQAAITKELMEIIGGAEALKE